VIVVVSSLFFFSQSFTKRRILLSSKIEKNVAFFYPQKFGHQRKNTREFFFCAPPLGLLFRSYLLAFAFFYSLVLARLFERLFLRAALGEREREREKERESVCWCWLAFTSLVKLG